ncbi:vacuolar protein sorting-associated protein 33B isoform X2 [Prorops nasuta]|uniref:vacuolar protein sorting-associated protein 33B isoform X2 n=1 Tax=Prorops nasuta TaxID=863751 RepID=UPI0034CE7F12
MDITLDDRLNVLQQISQRKLIEILDGISGSKDLIIEHRLMKILDTFVGVTALKRFGVEKIYKMEQGLKPTNTQRVFLVSSDLIACKRVLDQIHSEIIGSMNQNQSSYHVLVTPSVPAVLHSLIEEEGLSGLLSLYSLSYEFIKLDGNVLSLENPIFCDLYYHYDNALLPALARSLWSLQLILGSSQLTICLGKYSQQVLKLIESMEECLGSSSADKEVGAFIIIDRNCDFVSPLLTPVTYGGLLNEVLDVCIGNASSGSTQTKLEPSRDQIYGEVRDTPCSDVFPILHEKAKSLKTEQVGIQTMKLAEMERYVSTKLQKTRDMTRQLAFHISACQTIADTLGSEFQAIQTTEKLILDGKERKECLNHIERNIDEHPLRSLRLLCLLSVTSGGLSQSELLPIQKAHLHAHGYQNIPLFYKLQNTGLLKYKSENILHKLPNWNSEWTNQAQRLKLIPASSKRNELKRRTCPSYVFNNAYVPLIAQILNIVLNQDKEARLFDDLCGISNAEIAACRLVEKAAGIRLVLASDSIITGNKLIERIQET